MLKDDSDGKSRRTSKHVIENLRAYIPQASPKEKQKHFLQSTKKKFSPELFSVKLRVEAESEQISKHRMTRALFPRHHCFQKDTESEQQENEKTN